MALAPDPALKLTSRRNFLKQSLACLPMAAFPQIAARAAGMAASPALSRFIDPLPILKRLRPYAIRKGTKLYRIQAVEFTRRLHSQLPPARLWGYEGQYPGPVIEAFRGEPVEVQWQNNLPNNHIFTIDPRIHGAMPPAPAVRMVPHLHGSRTTSESDGLPEKWFTPGNSAKYFYPNEQPAATLWYHDHALGITRLNVYAGLSGFYLLRDKEELAMNLPSGDYEIPLLIQDRIVDAQGQLVYAPTHEDEVPLPPGVWGPEFFGNLPAVNGAIYPYLDVEPRPYRLRLLNGANSRFFHLYLNLARRPIDIPSLVPFQQIGTDGGFLPKPVSVNKLLLGPAERADVIVDFTGLENRIVTLSNDAAAPYPGWTAMKLCEPLPELMQFRVKPADANKKSSVSLALPASFRKLQDSPSIRTRNFVLSERLDQQGHSLGVRINDKGYDDPVTETVKLGSVEKWRFINTTDDAHPMHLHLVQFQILARQGFDSVALLRKGIVQLTGLPRAPEPYESGWKDTAVVHPGEALTILVPFEGHTGRYVFHCHMLEHEDNDMMRPYEVIA